MPSIAPRYDETVAKADYLQHMSEVAAKQDLSEDVRPRTLALSVSFTIMAAIVVVMRFLARRRQGAAFLIDDWLIVVSLALLVGNMIMNIVLINQGVGLHTGALSIDQLAVMNETLVGAEILYVTGVNMYKISLLFLYLRIFPTPDIRKWSRILGGASCAWNFACIFAAAFQCLPREKLWQPWIQGGCIDLFLTQLCISVPVIILDMAILLLPLPHVWRLKTNTTQRVCLTIIFLLGSYVVFTSIYRFVIFLGYTNEDNSFTLGDGIAWNVIEISSGIVSATLPTLGPLVRLAFKAVMPSALGGNSKYSRDALGSSGFKKSGGVVTIGGGTNTGTTGSRLSKAAMRSRREDSKYGFRPAVYGGASSGSASRRPEVSVSISHNRGGSVDDGTGYNSSVDEIPLTGISKETHVSWVVEERPPTSAPHERMGPRM